jgi:ribulose-5-phosphate 4-epimerase/fuculose-1-phosphate aldolase
MDCFTVADTTPDAFLLMYTFEAACMIQVRAQAGGGEAGGALAWPALQRKLDRIDPSYRN